MCTYQVTTYVVQRNLKSDPAHVWIDYTEYDYRTEVKKLFDIIDEMYNLTPSDYDYRLVLRTSTIIDTEMIGSRTESSS